MIRPSASRRRPFESLANGTAEMEGLLQAERDATPVVLNDWTHSVSDAIYTQYFDTGAFPNCVDSILANGQGRVQCLPDYILQAGTGLGLQSSSTSMEGAPTSTPSISMSGMARRSLVEKSSIATMSMAQDMTMAPVSTSSPSDGMTVASSTMPMPSSMSSMSSAMTSLSPRGCTPPMMFKPGFNSSSLPPETCTNTTSALLTIPGNSTQGWLSLNLVNAGSVSKLGVSLDAHSMFVYAADGLFVELQEVKVCILHAIRSTHILLTLYRSYIYRLGSVTPSWSDSIRRLEITH